jgi:hypothetical protein
MELLSSPYQKLAKLLLFVSKLFSFLGEIAATQVESLVVTRPSKVFEVFSSF